jgi:tetratricopeptide (TPR) repeat protein
VLHGGSYSAESLTRAMDWLEDAIERDPDYFPAHIARVDLYDTMRRTGMLERELSPETLSRLVEAVAARWPDRPEVRIWQARLVLYDVRNPNPRWESAARNIEYALGAEPANLEYLAEASNLANRLNRDELALEIAEYTVARDPLCAVCYLSLAGALMGEEQYEAAVENFEVAITLDPTLIVPAYPLALVFIGQAERALEIFRSPEYNFGRPGQRISSVGGSAIALHYLGRLEESQAAIEELRQMDFLTGNALAQVYALTGDIDAAFETINSLPRDQIIVRAFDNALRSLKDHPNWPELGSRLGIWPDDPRDAVSFSVNLPSY